MKKNLTDSEIAHVWVSGAAAFGHTPIATIGRNGPQYRGYRQHFDGDAFYSYSTVITRRLGGAYILDESNFGPTTRKHLEGIRSALRGREDKTFHVHCGTVGQDLKFTPARLRDYYWLEFQGAAAARSKVSAARDTLIRASRLQSAIDVCQYYGLGAKRLFKAQAAFEPVVLAARALLAAHDKAVDDRRELKSIKDNMARVKYGSLDAARAIALARAVLAGEKSFTDDMLFRAHSGFGYQDYYLSGLPELQAAIRAKRAEEIASRPARWLAGEAVCLPDVCNSPTLCRREGEELVTSRGARVPMAAAERVYKFAQARRAAGWHRNGETCEVGHYSLDAVNAQGIVAGCHRISWEEIERFANQEGWTA
jgi:hypothetical protein